MNTCVLYAQADKCIAFSILCVCDGKRERRIANHNFLTRAHKKTNDSICLCSHRSVVQLELSCVDSTWILGKAGRKKQVSVMSSPRQMLFLENLIIPHLPEDLNCFLLHLILPAGRCSQ